MFSSVLSKGSDPSIHEVIAESVTPNWRAKRLLPTGTRHHCGDASAESFRVCPHSKSIVGPALVPVTQKVSQLLVDGRNIFRQDVAVIPPLRCRKIMAEMKLKNLSLQFVAAATHVPYTTASRLLKGREHQPDYLRKIERYVSRHPIPREEVHA
jgi:hypothetical protein